MTTFTNIVGVPDFKLEEFAPKRSDFCLLIPIINEDGRITHELERAQNAAICNICDIALCDAGSTDGSTDSDALRALDVNALLVKTGAGKQGAQLRMGIYWALRRGYDGIITVDGNDKDSIESVPLFIDKLQSGCDFIQGSRFVTGGQAINTPLSRLLAVRLLHAPITSLASHFHFTDTTNAFRGHSRRYLEDGRVAPLREVFSGYELLAYLSTRWASLGYSACEVPVRREYPATGKTPTKISPLSGNLNL
ncbi:MAG: glycosyltransferase family 2 protein, partial [Oscillospiraceae bacterium]